MPLVEIVGGIASRQDVLQEIKKLVAGWGKVPVLAKDTPGFIVNRIARPYYGEAIRISERRNCRLRYYRLGYEAIWFPDGAV
jgi:3-hydroxybutyryl-CoA dehydrogenase